MVSLRPIVRSFDRFRRDPTSAGAAGWLIAIVTVAAVFLGSIVVWLFDKRDFTSYGDALWFALQTVTTVGYGDVTPTSALGRTVAAIVMLVSISFIAIVTAVVTSSFIEAAQRKRRTVDDAQDASDAEELRAALAAITDRLDRIEGKLPGESSN